MLGDIAQIRVELDKSRSDVSLINRRLDVVQANGPTDPPL